MPSQDDHTANNQTASVITLLFITLMTLDASIKWLNVYNLSGI